MTAIFKKELRNYFNTVIGWGYLGFFVLLTGYFFVSQNVSMGSMNYNDTLASSMTMFIILTPVLTMRLFSEEKRQKTDQLLYSSPVTVKSIVAGKFLAAMVIFVLGVLITGFFPIMLNEFGDVDWGLLFAGAFGYILMGMCMISVGIYISAITDNQIIAATVTFGTAFILLSIDDIAASAPISAGASIICALLIVAVLALVVFGSTKNPFVAGIVAILGAAAVMGLYLIMPNLYDGLIINILGWFSVLNRYENFYIGILSVSDIAYYITFAFAFLYLSANVIEKRRWN